MKKSVVILSTILLGAAIVGCTSVKYKNKHKVNESQVSADGQKELANGQKELANGQQVIEEGHKEITLEEAKTIALNNAGLTEAEVTFGEINKELDDGISKYEIEFYAGNVEYDYEIDAKTGEVISSTIDK